MFLWVKDSVAAVKIESSCMGVEGMALGSEEDMFSAGPSSVPGEGGGVGYASCPGDCDFDCHMERKLSKPLTFGRSHWYVMG